MKTTEPTAFTCNPGPSPEARIARREGVVLRQVAGESMLVPTVTREVDLDSLFLLNAAGSFIWEQMEGPRSVAELGTAVAEKFAIEPARAIADVEAFLTSLLARNLAKRIGADDR